MKAFVTTSLHFIVALSIYNLILFSKDESSFSPFYYYVYCPGVLQYTKPPNIFSDHKHAQINHEQL